MSDQLAAGLVLGVVAAGAAGTGLRWLAIAALAAAIPFLTVGVALTLGGVRTARGRRLDSAP